MFDKIELNALNTKTKNIAVEEEIASVQQRLLEQQGRLLGSTVKVLRLQKEAKHLCDTVSEKAQNLEVKTERMNDQEKSIAVWEDKVAKMMATAEEREDRVASLQKQHKLLETSLVGMSTRMTDLQERIAKKRELVRQKKLKKVSLEESK